MKIEAVQVNNECEESSHEVTITTDEEPDLPAITIEGLCMHVQGIPIKLPPIYLLTHGQIVIREKE